MTAQRGLKLLLKMLRSPASKRWGPWEKAIKQKYYPPVRVAHWYFMCHSGEGRASQVVLVVKNPPANAGHGRDMDSLPLAPPGKPSLHHSGT